MRYIELRQALKNFTVFSLADIKSLDSGFYRRRLNEWQDKGYIRKIIKGYYIFSDLELNEKRLFEIANRIYNPSYVSFETALSYYGLIPESVYGITSASTRRTSKFDTAMAAFSYRTVRPCLFFGYNIVKYENRQFKIASAEKALLDYFYINPNLKTAEDFTSLRISRDALSGKVKKSTFNAYLRRFGKKSLAKRMKLFWEVREHA